MQVVMSGPEMLRAVLAILSFSMRWWETLGEEAAGNPRLGEEVVVTVCFC